MQVHLTFAHQSSFSLPINDASISANHTQNVQPDSACLLISPLVCFSHLYQWQHSNRTPCLPQTYIAEQCSMFETRPSLETRVSLGDTKLINTAENYIKLPAPATEQLPSTIISAEVEVLGILSTYTNRYCIQNELRFHATSSNLLNLAPVDESPVPSPPASLRISSRLSSSELQNSQNQSFRPDTVLDLSPTFDIPEPSPTNNRDLSSSPLNSSPARIFSSSPFVSSQSSLPASDEPKKVSICILIIYPDHLTHI